MNELSEKIIIITGAAGLLGSQYADAIFAAGGIPVLLDNDAPKLDLLKKLLEKKYKNPVLTMNTDITSDSSVQKASSFIYTNYGRIDGLINNAARNPKVDKDGLHGDTRLENFDINAFSQDVSVGLTGAVICCKYFGQLMARNSGGGSIINVSSDLGLIAPNQGLYRVNGLPAEEQPVKPVSYSVVKAGIIGLTRYMATYWARDGVRCNAICPGGVENNQSSEFLSRISELIPMGRMAQPNEFNGAVVWLLGASSSYVNGAVISLDGGRSAW